MEYLHEGVFLGIDAILLGFCVKEYCSQKHIINALKVSEWTGPQQRQDDLGTMPACLQGAAQVTLNKELAKTLLDAPGKRLDYAVIRGTVVPVGSPMKAVMSPSVTAVLQVMKLYEHRISKGIAGFWTEHSKLLHMSCNEVPFCLENEGGKIEVLDAFSSHVLDLDVVYDNYEPSRLSFFDHIFGFISGVSQRGHQTTEEVLREGSYITAIGEIELSDTGMRIQPSRVGPMFLTTATKGTVLRRLEEAKSSTLLKIVICSTVGAVLIALIARKVYKKRKAAQEEEKFRESMDKSRKERRSKQRIETISDEQRCVVCVTNPKEVIVLPCGHVCLCEDCAIQIKSACPVCRCDIKSKAAAYYS